jgi:hypothetical protein
VVVDLLLAELDEQIATAANHIARNDRVQNSVQCLADVLNENRQTLSDGALQLVQVPVAETGIRQWRGKKMNKRTWAESGG